MAFKTKVDYFGIADSNSIICVSSSDGATASEATAQGEDGSIIASQVYGATSAPSCDYELKADLTNKVFTLGSVTTVGTKYYALTEVSIKTTAGGAVKISAKGEEVNSATASCTYTVTVASLLKKFHAQIINSAATLSGTGCHLTGATFTASCALGKATKDGECIAFDVSEGKITESFDIVQAGDTAPSLTAGTNWAITAPLAETNPDSDYPTFSAEATMYLAKDSASNG